MSKLKKETVPPTMDLPYTDLPPSAFWRTGVSDQLFDAIAGLYSRKFVIDRSMKIATAGSCFAQHIANHLRARGFTVIDKEPSPPGLDGEGARRFGYGIYSARYGNIYSARQLRQFIEEAFARYEPADAVWEKGGRYFDAMRPSVEPNGLATSDLVREHREYHLRRVRRVLRSADILVFTLGLTEAWEHAPSGTIYPTAPGTIAGRFDPGLHRFRNFTFDEIHQDMIRAFELCKQEKTGMRFVLTVSPVPLIATASGQHVLQATMYSKAVLRAVAGQLFHDRADVEYVPSYELITSTLSAGRFFDSNHRTVRPEGVEAVMRMFFAQHDSVATEQIAPQPKPTADEKDKADDEAVCEEVLLEAFAP